MLSYVADILNAIETYIDVVESPTLTAEDRLAQLPAALDSLAIAVRHITFEFDEAEYPEGPREDYQATTWQSGVISRLSGTITWLAQLQKKLANPKFSSGTASMTS